MSRPTFETKFFKLTAPDAKAAVENNGGYDLIIVGAGFGGGVLAGALFDKKLHEDRPNPGGGVIQGKKILVIERGHLDFTTHCLNTARAGGTGDSGQQNDTFFTLFKSEYATDPAGTPGASPDWKGGPVYTLGGRSNTWGLFVPRPNNRTLDDHFPATVVADLRSKYFEKAESLVQLGYPETKPVHQRLMDNLNVKDGVKWQWGRIASEFKGDTNFKFARGAYGTVDKLLEIAMVDPDKMAQPNLDAKFKILLNAEVRTLQFDANNAVTSVTLGDTARTVIKAKKVVLWRRKRP